MQSENNKTMENKQIKCTCERPDDYACDYCEEQELKRIMKEAKERHSNQETLEEAAKKYHEDNEFKSYYPHSPYSFIDGAKWQADRMYSEEDMKEAFKIGFNLGCNAVESLTNEIAEEWFKNGLKKFKNK